MSDEGKKCEDEETRGRGEGMEMGGIGVCVGGWGHLLILSPSP